MQNRDKSYSQMKKDQLGRESELLSQLMGSSDELKSLSGYDTQMNVKRNEILFKVTTEMEDTKNALKEAEALVERLRKHLAQLEGMHKILTKK
jgi:phosphoribosylaminoimidazole carboxylase (NCAIR synthetase)